MTKNDEIKKKLLLFLKKSTVFLGDIDRSSVSGQIINKFHYAFCTCIGIVLSVDRFGLTR